MKRRTKKLFSLMLSITLVVGMIPAFGVTAHAAEKLETPQGGWNGTCIQWHEVPNATEYSIYLLTTDPNDSMGGSDILVDIIELKTDGTFINRVNDDSTHNPDPYKVEYDMNTRRFMVDCTNLITITTNSYQFVVKAHDTSNTFETSDACTESMKTGQELLDGFMSDEILMMGITAYAPTHVSTGYSSVYETAEGVVPFGTINEGQKVRVIETQGPLAKINYGSGYGWVESESLKPIEHIATHTVIPGALNVRNGPGTDYPRIGGVFQGSTVEVVEIKGEWLKYIYRSIYGWSQSRYMRPIPMYTCIDELTGDEVHYTKAGRNIAVTGAITETAPVTITGYGSSGRMVFCRICNEPDTVSVQDASFVKLFWIERDGFVPKGELVMISF